jgi:PTH1 family peptidyl-tRNA hydrolase
MQKSNPSCFLVVGLGNPGLRYRATYHSIGAMCVTSYAKERGLAFGTPRGKPFCYAKDATSNSVFVLPLTFMNDSGSAVAQALAYFKKTPAQLLVVHDDSDMNVGACKFSFDQRSAGHKGIQSIIDALGTQKFRRLKIGVRSARERSRKKAETFVLKRISSRDKTVLEHVFKEAEKDLASENK